MISKREALSSRGQLVVKEMQASVSRATALVENVLDFARGRLGDGLTLTRHAAQPLTPVLEQVVGEIRAIAPDRQIIAHFSIEHPVDCDPGRIGQLAISTGGTARAETDVRRSAFCKCSELWERPAWAD
jgi:sigma-B regulation protein RsbU (phosphoserine phosphatase)